MSTPAYGLARVSGSAQQRNGFSLEAQERAIREYAASAGYDLRDVVPITGSARKGKRGYGEFAAKRRELLLEAI